MSNKQPEHDRPMLIVTINEILIKERKTSVHHIFTALPLVEFSIAYAKQMDSNRFFTIQNVEVIEIDEN